MIEFNYRTKDNYIKVIKYLIGLLLVFGLTTTYFMRNPDFSLLIGGIFLVMCALLAIPFTKAFMQAFFEKLVVTSQDIRHHRGVNTLIMPWKSVQYFVRLPTRGVFSGLVIYYELGDFKKKMLFDSTISNKEELITFIQQHVGKLRKMRKVYR